MGAGFGDGAGLGTISGSGELLALVDGEMIVLNLSSGFGAPDGLCLAEIKTSENGLAPALLPAVVPEAASEKAGNTLALLLPFADGFGSALALA